ncbi:MAG: hypothetical protein KF845_15930 [Cyclobacteriaceae bacterium]|nr:hypothetical protein [Cyclobacteriaceae bacterium]
MMKKMLYSLSLLIFLNGGFSVAQQTSSSGFETPFIHTDKMFYQAGDVIWFKFYLTNQPYVEKEFSVIAYLDLLDAENNVLKRLKLKCIDGRSYGQIELPGSLATGIYTLKPYTLWMKNVERGDYDFTKQILIYNTLDQTDPAPLIDSIKSFYSRPPAAERSFGLVIETNKIKYAPRERVQVNIKIEGRSKASVDGNFSVSVRMLNDSAIHSRPAILSETGYTLKQTPTVKYSKERLVYPVSANSLHPLEDYSSALLVSDDLSTIEFNPVYEEQILINQIKTSYQTADGSFSYSYLKLPADILYFPDDFEVLETVEDFIDEIITQAKVFKRKGKKIIRVRNSENSQNIFFYEHNPLFIIDGYITDDVDFLLNIEPYKIRSIEIAWSLPTINSAGVNALADNGIFAIYTKSGLGANLGLKKLYDEFHEPAVFKNAAYNRKTSQETIPDFRGTLYWNHNVQHSEASKLVFYTSDEIGKLVIEAVGVTEDGLLVSGRKVVEVEHAKSIE